MRKFILPVCLLLSSLTKAQESKWAVSLIPAIVQSPGMHLGFQPGVEYRFNDRLSLLTEITLTTKSKDPSFSNSKYFRVKPELRYALRESKRGRNYYTGIQLSYTFRKWENSAGGCYFNNKMWADSTTGYDKATINSSIFSCSLQFGTPFSFGKHFSMDVFMGLGVRMIFTGYTNVENVVKHPYMRPTCKIFPAPDPAWYVNGTIKRFHSNMGIRFFYHF